MKYLLIIACLLFTTCKSNTYYRMKITYVVNNHNGSTYTQDRYQKLTAPNDSIAFVHATINFNQRIEENDKTKAQCDHFELYDHKGNLVKPK